jgi:glycosyltransferase involved in cell wall biosynthesis
MSLALDARRRPDARRVSMMDNIFLDRPKQWAGLVWFRAVLRRHIDALWVPGRRARAFARMLGMAEHDIIDRLYGADPCLFSPVEGPEAAARRRRSGALFVGQLIERKGVPALLAAAARSVRFASGLTLVGDGPLAPEIARHGVRLHGFLPPAQLAPLYAQHSLFILPSRVDHWGVVLHEAALAGCLLAATRDCGAVDDLIVHGCNGYVMDHGTPEEILAATIWAEQLTAHEVAAGRRLSMDRAAAFGPSAFCRAFAGLLEVAR